MSQNQNQNEPTTINDEFYEDAAESESSLSIQQELDEKLEGDLEFIRTHGKVVNRMLGTLYSEFGRVPTIEEVSEFEKSLSLLEDYYNESISAVLEARANISRLSRKGD